MQFMCMLKHDEQAPTPIEVSAAMAEFEQEGRRNGTLVELGGLMPSAAGAIVSLADGRISHVDGPFAESKELVGGYAIVDVHSRDEAVELGRRLMAIHLEHAPGWAGSCEIRQIAG